MIHDIGYVMSCHDIGYVMMSCPYRVGDDVMSMLLALWDVMSAYHVATIVLNQKIVSFHKNSIRGSGGYWLIVCVEYARYQIHILNLDQQRQVVCQC